MFRVLCVHSALCTLCSLVRLRLVSAELCSACTPHSRKLTLGLTCAAISPHLLCLQRVPAENMLGMEGEGFRSLMLNFNHERWCGKTTACRVISNATRSYVKTGSGQTSRQLREIERSVFRRSIAVQALRSSRVCIEESIRYARRRQTFGQPLAQHQVIRHFAPRFWPKATHTRFLPRQASCQ